MTVTPEEHGAAGDGIQDDGPALRAALQAAIETEAVLLLRPGRTYRAGAGILGDAALEAIGPAAVRILGAGATLVVTEPSCGAVLVRGSRSVDIEGLTVDYDPLPYTQGEIVSVSSTDRSFVTALDDGYPPLDHPGFRYASTQRLPRSFMTVFDRADRAIKRGIPDCILLQAAKRRPDGCFDVVLSERNLPFDLEVGDRYVYIQRERGNGLVFDQCGSVSVEMVTVMASPGVAFLGFETNTLSIRDSAVTRPTGSSRLISTNADAVHCQGMRTGPMVAGCLFERMLDDGVNVYASPSMITRVDGCDMWLQGGTSVRVGDDLELFDHRAGVLRGTVSVQQVVTETDGSCRVTLSSAVPAVTTGAAFPDCDIAVNRSASGQGFEIRGNTFRWSRARAVVLRAGGGVVADNDMHDLSLWAIEVANDADWPEGPLPSDIVIENNRIGPVGRAGPSPAILVAGRRAGGRPPPTPLVHRIRVVGNVIRDWSGSIAIVVEGAEDVTIEENSLSRTEPPEMS